MPELPRVSGKDAITAFLGAGFEVMRIKGSHHMMKKEAFRQRPKVNAPVQWVSPQLVCEVSFQEWSEGGRMRQPIFVGLREDKPAVSVHRERPVVPDRIDA